MSQLVLTLKLPEDVSESVRRTAKGMKQPVEQALVAIVRAATPALAKVPLEFRADLEAMEDLDDEQLLQATEQRLSSAKQRRLDVILGNNQQRALTSRENESLRRLRTEADRLTLRRAYASLLLKYRGHRIPSLPGTRQ
jgi:hypothetical protein